MLSKRGTKSAESETIPWRFAPGGSNRYDKTTNPTGIIPFGSAENDLVREELHQFISQNVQIPSLALTYRFSRMGGPLFPVAMATHINEYFLPHTVVKAEQILTTVGLTPMHSLLAHSLGDPGDGILVTRPIYGRFELDFGNVADLEIVYVEMDSIDPFEIGVVGCYEKAFERAAKEGVKIRALLIVNPHNPLGRCYPESTLREIMRFCQRHQIHLISDEIYALSVFDTENDNLPGFTSVLSINPQDVIDIDRLHVLYGMSKDFAAAGLRLGCVITQNTMLRQAITANIRFHSPSGPSVAIGTAILEDREFVKEFIRLSRERLSETHKYTTQVLENAAIRYQKSNAGFFVYIDLSPWLRGKSEKDQSGNEPEYELAQRLLDGGVGLHPCEEHNELPGHFRLVFSQEKEVLEEGLERLVSILEGIQQEGVPGQTTETAYTQ